MDREHIEITLGGQAYTVYALPIRDSKAWRADFVTTLKPLLDGLRHASALQFNTAQDLAGLMPLLEKLLTEGIDRLIDLLFAYAPDLAAQRETIEATATDKEAVTAFKEVLALADPFGLLGAFTVK